MKSAPSTCRIPVMFALALAGAFSAAALAGDVRVDRVMEWRSPLGLTIAKHEIRIDGAPLIGHRRVELRDSAGALIHRRDDLQGALRVLEEKRAPLSHPFKPAHDAAARPLVRESRSPAWMLHDGQLRAVIRERKIDLRDRQEPVAVERLRDASTGEILRTRPLILEAAPQGFHVYADADGKPALSPWGDTWPHPTGIPDGWVPTVPSAQAVVSQGDAATALDDPWLADATVETRGNNVIAFFNSIIDDNGVVLEEFEEAAWWVLPDAAQGDFLAQANSGSDFVYAYDPSQTVNEYFQVTGETPPLPDADDAALNAKIVQAFYATNWLHDFFYRAGFDEIAGNSQTDNFGRGGMDNDPLYVLSGYPNTFAVPLPDGEPAYIAIGLNTTSASKRDDSMDFPVTAHEWGHVMIGRLAGPLQELQSRAINEGLADFIGVLVGVSAGDDLSGAFALGHYMNMDYVRPAVVPPAGVEPDAMYYGIRRYPYSTDMTRNPLTLRNLVEEPALPYYDWKGRGPHLSEPHTAGEIIGQAFFQCFAEIAEGADAAGFEAARLRMAQYLVAALMLFSEHPTFLEARNHMLTVMGAVNDDDRNACRAGFAARGMGAGAIGPQASDEDFFTRVEDGFLDQDEKLVIINEIPRTGLACADCGDGILAGSIEIELVNAGMIESTGIEFIVTPELSSAVEFPEGNTVTFERIAPQESVTFEIPVRVDMDALSDGVMIYDLDARIAGASEASGDYREGGALFTVASNGGGGGGGSSGFAMFAILAFAVAQGQRRR